MDFNKKSDRKSVVDLGAKSPSHGSRETPSPQKVGDQGEVIKEPREWLLRAHKTPQNTSNSIPKELEVS